MSGPEVEPPLFYQPGKAGFYSVNMATPTLERLNAFRGIGQMIGLSLLLAEVFPLPLCRHVLKFIMMKEVREGRRGRRGEGRGGGGRGGEGRGGEGRGGEGLVRG